MLEDTPNDAELAERELRKAGITFTSIRVETRDTFIRALEEFRPDIILSDYKLPDFDGMTALEIVLRDHPEIPMIMVTGVLTDIEAVEFIHAGARDYILKERLARLGPAVQRTLAAEQGIRARKRAEIIAERERIRLRTILKTASDGIHILDCDGILVEANDAFLNMLGLDHSAIGKLRVTDWDVQSSWANIKARIDELIAHHGKVVFETRFRRSDDVILDVEINSSGIEIEGKGYIYAASRDITLRKAAAEKQHLRELSAHLQAVREEEKTSLAREIHDDLGSTLAALKIEAHALDSGLSAEQKATPLFARVESMIDLLESALAATRRIITDLRPTILDDYGLVEALKWQADQFHKHTGIECHVACAFSKDNCSKDCIDRLDKTLSINLFRIFQEALTNAARHSGASRVEAEFRPGNNEVVLLIKDNGRGLSEGNTIASTSFGIRGMRERVLHLGGEIGFDNLPGGGLGMTVRCPQNSNVGCPHMED